MFCNSTPGFDPEGSGPADVIAFPSLSQLFGNKTKEFAQNLADSIPQWAKTQSVNGISADALQTIFEAQAKPILHDNGKCGWNKLRYLRNLMYLISSSCCGVIFRYRLPYVRTFISSSSLIYDSCHYRGIAIAPWTLLPFSRGNVTIVVRERIF